MITPAYRYRATLLRVVDGDTIWLDVDLGFYAHAHLNIRVRNVDAVELRATGGDAARAFTERVLREARELVIESYRDAQSFARWVCDVWVDGVLLADLLREHGHVKSTAAT